MVIPMHMASAVIRIHRVLVVSKHVLSILAEFVPLAVSATLRVDLRFVSTVSNNRLLHGVRLRLNRMCAEVVLRRVSFLCVDHFDLVVAQRQPFIFLLCFLVIKKDLFVRIWRFFAFRYFAGTGIVGQLRVNHIRAAFVHLNKFAPFRLQFIHTARVGGERWVAA